MLHWKSWTRPRRKVCLNNIDTISNYYFYSPNKRTPRPSFNWNRLFDSTAVVTLTIAYSGRIFPQMVVNHLVTCWRQSKPILVRWKVWKLKYPHWLLVFKDLVGLGLVFVPNRADFERLLVQIKTHWKLPLVWCPCLASMSGSMLTICNTKMSDPIMWMQSGRWPTGKTSKLASKLANPRNKPYPFLFYNTKSLIEALEISSKHAFCL